MKPIKIYFAAAWAGGGQGERFLVEEGIKNKLCSFVYPTQLSGWLEAIQEAPDVFRGSIMIDSGAFSAWNKGQKINLDTYIEYAHKAIANAEKVIEEIKIVNLDVIPGKVGQTKSLTKNFSNPDNTEVIEKAAAEGYKNLRKMIKNGITPIHVFHQGEHFKWLDRMVEKTDYIGISPANDMHSISRRNWIESVFEYLYKNNIDVKTHGFAVHARSVLINYPWTSCDAASWRISAGMGNIYFPAGGYKNPDFSKKGITLNVSERKTGRGVGKMTGKVIEVLEESGFSYQDLQSWQTRTRLNIRYFLALEKWINQERKGIKYKSKNRLL